MDGIGFVGPTINILTENELLDMSNTWHRLLQN